MGYHLIGVLCVPLNWLRDLAEGSNSEYIARVVLLWLKPPLANDFCNFLNKIAKIMKIFVEVDLLKGYQPLCQR